MIDIEIVKENYRRMSDDQLIRFAKLEAENLSLEAFHALKDELSLRNVDLNIIEDLEDVDIPEKNANNSVTHLFVDSLFEFVLDEKSKGIPNNEIYHSLLAKNLKSEQSLMLLQMFEEVAKKALKNIETDILFAWISFFIGIMLCIFFFNPLDFKFFIGAIVILGASIKLANSYPIKKKIILALEKCKEEAESNIKNLYQ